MNGRSVTLTGATGYLGAHLLTDLAAAGCAAHCVVRADEPESARQRLADAATSYGLPKPPDSVVPWCGDLGAPRLGMTDGEFHRLGREVDLVIHSGAQVNLAYPYRTLKAVNVGGIQEMLRLASVNGAPFHVSTLSVLGEDLASPELLRLAHGPWLGDGYSRSKWVADRMVASARSANNRAPACPTTPEPSALTWTLGRNPIACT